MRKIFLAGLTGIALAAAAPAYAASGGSTATDQEFNQLRMDCFGLQDEFDQAQPYARMNGALPVAEYLRGVGGRYCRAGSYSDGISTLHSALSLLHINPLTETGPIEDGAG